MAFAIGAGIAAGSMVSGYFGSQAAGQAAGAERDAAGVQADIYRQQRADLQPYYQAGYGALSQIQANMPSYNKPFTMNDFTHNEDPGYGFRLSQGENAVNRAAAASGGAVGGSALQSLGNYAQGAASQEYGAAFERYQNQISNSYNRLLGVAGLGSNAIQTGTAAGTTAGQGIAGSIASAGQAQAGGNLAIGNAITGGISSGIGAYQGSQVLAALRDRNAATPGQSGGLSPAAMSTLSAYQPQGGLVPSGGSYAGPDTVGLNALRTS